MSNNFFEVSRALKVRCCLDHPPVLQLPPTNTFHSVMHSVKIIKATGVWADSFSIHLIIYTINYLQLHHHHGKAAGRTRGTPTPPRAQTDPSRFGVTAWWNSELTFKCCSPSELMPAVVKYEHAVNCRKKKKKSTHLIFCSDSCSGQQTKKKQLHSRWKTILNGYWLQKVERVTAWDLFDPPAWVWFYITPQLL